jgi:hypothetical protein
MLIQIVLTIRIIIITLQNLLIYLDMERKELVYVMFTPDDQDRQN